MQHDVDRLCRQHLERLLDKGEIRLVTGVHTLINLVRSEPSDMSNKVRVTRRFDAKAREKRQGWHGIVNAEV